MPRILIVEDNEMNRDMLSRRLQRQGYDVELAVDGESGVAAAQANPPALIIMDLSLPGLDGWESTRLLRTIAATRDVPIIALTAHAISNDRERAIAAGCSDYDTKPVDLARLLGKIARFIGPPPAAADPTPVEMVPEPIAEPVDAPARGGLEGGVKILLVEDNEMNRDMLSRRLTRQGYDVVLAVDGEQGVELAQSEVPDLILMDLSLPGLDGWEATRLLKAMPGIRRIPIIALTAHAMTGDRDKAIEAGCDDYDTKPVEFKRLLGKIETRLTKAGVRPPSHS